MSSGILSSLLVNKLFTKLSDKIIYPFSLSRPTKNKDMKVKISYFSHYGKIRSNNEDSVLVHNQIISEINMDSPMFLDMEISSITLAVADGMGGHSKGEVASRKVLEVLKEDAEPYKTKKYFSKLLQKAKSILNDIAKKDINSVGLGTTVSGIYLSNNKCTIFSCGDSRVYWINKHRQVHRLTVDHSLVQRLCDMGLIKEEEMRTHPQKNIITSAISGDMQKGKLEFQFSEIKIEPGNAFLICTDGLWESMSSVELQECISKGDITSIVESLKNKSLKTSAKDNISLIYVEIIST